MDQQDIRRKRKAAIRKLILQILSGKFNNESQDPNNLFNEMGSSRRTYYSPLDRSSYNYGYMTMEEIGAGSPNVW